MSDSQFTEPKSSNKPPPEIPGGGKTHYPNPPEISGAGKAHFPNPPETVNPDAAALREQWKFAIRQYSKWYSHAWGTAILAGASFFALGWLIKGSNPLPSFDSNRTNKTKPDDDTSSKAAADQLTKPA